MKVISAAVLLAFAVSGTVRAERVLPPAVPFTLTADAGLRPFLVGHAIGTQNYLCTAAATPAGGDWLFIGPQATLFDTNDNQVITHFFSRNPEKDNAIQATWQHSRDTSAVWAVKRVGSSDPAYVAPGAIEWLLLDATGAAIGPTGGDKLSQTKAVQRVNTSGGIKPPAGECSTSTIGARKFVPYEADYYFYK